MIKIIFYMCILTIPVLLVTLFLAVILGLIL